MVKVSRVNLMTAECACCGTDIPAKSANLKVDIKCLRCRLECRDEECIQSRKKRN